MNKLTTCFAVCFILCILFVLLEEELLRFISMNFAYFFLGGIFYRVIQWKKSDKDKLI